MKYNITLTVHDDDEWLEQFENPKGINVLNDRMVMTGTTAAKILNAYQDPEHLTFSFKDGEIVGD